MDLGGESERRGKKKNEVTITTEYRKRGRKPLNIVDETKFF